MSHEGINYEKLNQSFHMPAPMPYAGGYGCNDGLGLGGGLIGGVVLGALLGRGGLGNWGGHGGFGHVGGGFAGAEALGITAAKNDTQNVLGSIANLATLTSTLTGSAKDAMVSATTGAKDALVDVFTTNMAGVTNRQFEGLRAIDGVNANTNAGFAANALANSQYALATQKSFFDQAMLTNTGFNNVEKSLCAINSNMDKGFCATNVNIDRVRTDSLIALKDAQIERLEEKVNTQQHLFLADEIKETKALIASFITPGCVKACPPSNGGNSGNFNDNNVIAIGNAVASAIGNTVGSPTFSTNIGNTVAQILSPFASALNTTLNTVNSLSNDVATLTKAVNALVAKTA